jgi:hypothetical protein
MYLRKETHGSVPTTCITPISVRYMLYINYIHVCINHRLIDALPITPPSSSGNHRAAERRSSRMRAAKASG